MIAFALAAMMQIGQVANPTDFSKDLVKLMETEWPQNRTVNIVCHGHSVPAGYFKTPDVRTFDAYPHLLHRAIKDHFKLAVVNVIVTAIGGENSVSGAARFEKDVLALNPDVVTIDYALNDRGLSLEDAKKAWIKMIRLAQEKKVKVILLTPTWDLSVNPDNSDDPLFKHAQQIRELAKEFSVGLADSLSAFLAEHKQGVKFEALMSQINHPNRAGHELVVNELAPWFGIKPSK
jgi:lysophospholipase L1-like esterase